ncbi:hypothetical protein H2248_006642 [Termitomyces sp. 'cryptogamus']|nr:hypothetical protein H2248_006642 [Termitomyces sp. 'cryptogamus']
MAVSIHLLEFYHALFEWSCNVVNALLSTFTTGGRSFILLSQKEQPVCDAFQRGLGQVIQWYDNLNVHIKQKVKAATISANQMIQGLRQEGSATISPQLLNPLQGS